jgi:hypothetical protein
MPVPVVVRWGGRERPAERTMRPVIGVVVLG